MSYDLHAFRAVPGVSVDEAWRCVVDAEEADEAPPHAIAPEIVERLARRIEKQVGLERFQKDLAAIAEFEKISVEEARERYNSIELNADESVGLQIQLRTSSVSVTLPYWHSGAAAEHAFAKIAACIAIFRDEGLSVYDPQLDKPLESDADLRAAAQSYQGGVGNVRDLAAKYGGGTRPWWKFW